MKKFRLAIYIILTVFLAACIGAYSSYGASSAAFADFEEPVVRRVILRLDGQILLDKEYVENPSVRTYLRAENMTRGVILKTYISAGYSPCIALDFMYENLGTDIEKISEALRLEPKDASVKFLPSSTKKFAYVKEEFGLELDINKLLSDLENSLAFEASELELKTKSIAPKYTVSELKKASFKRGEFSTFYGSSSEGRKTNVELAARAISGTRLSAGETFSFNATVGARTEKRGYKSANVIVDGVYVEGVGGGVCQVSTTLYNAVLLSGLEIIECTRHTLASSYVAPSLDAMVSEFSDLKFRNCTGRDVYIEVSCDGENITAAVYGETVGADVKYYLESVVIKRLEPEPYELIFDSSIKEGVKVIKTPEHIGYISEAYLIKREGGKEIFRRRIRRDEYVAKRGVLLVGTGA